MSDEQKVDKRSASQKLADAENAIMSLFQVVDRMGRDLLTAKDALKLLNNKVDSILKASQQGESLSDAVIERIMVENNVADLSQKVAAMVAQGIVAPEDTVSENSFVVGSEYEQGTDTLVNPRIQFALKAIAPALQAKLVGAKVGETLVLEEGKLTFKVLESYAIKAGETAAVAPTATEETPAQEEVPAAQAQ